MNQATFSGFSGPPEPSGSDERYSLLKGHWNAILDNLLDQNRIAWLAYFDARLVEVTGDTLTLSFTDSEKFVGGHDFLAARNPEHKAALIRAILEETSLEIDIAEEQSP